MLFGANLPYIILVLFSGVSIIRIIADRKSAFVTLLLNLLFGGTFFILLNICKVEIPLNWWSGSCVTLLGVPGVLLMLILKFTFNIF